MMPTLPLLSGVFFTSQSMVSQVSVAWSTWAGFRGPRRGRFITYSPSEPYLPRTSWIARM